jgi:hypothetical protein
MAAPGVGSTLPTLPFQFTAGNVTRQDVESQAGRAQYQGWLTCEPPSEQHVSRVMLVWLIMCYVLTSGCLGDGSPTMYLDSCARIPIFLSTATVLSTREKARERGPSRLSHPPPDPLTPAPNGRVPPSTLQRRARSPQPGRAPAAPVPVHFFFSPEPEARVRSVRLESLQVGTTMVHT